MTLVLASHYHNDVHEAYAPTGGGQKWIRLGFHGIEKVGQVLAAALYDGPSSNIRIYPYAAKLDVRL